MGKDSFQELLPPGAALYRLGSAYWVIEKTLDNQSGSYEGLEAFTIILIKQNGQPLVNEIHFGRLCLWLFTWRVWQVKAGCQI